MKKIPALNNLGEPSLKIGHSYFLSSKKNDYISLTNTIYGERTIHIPNETIGLLIGIKTFGSSIEFNFFIENKFLTYIAPYWGPDYDYSKFYGRFEEINYHDP